MPSTDSAPEPLQVFCGLLRELRRQSGNPTLAQLRTLMTPRMGGPRPSESTLSDLLNAKIKRAPRWELVDGFVSACGAYASKQKARSGMTPGIASLETWRARHGELEQVLELMHRHVHVHSTVPATVSAVRALPPDIPNFTGRKRELERLVDVVTSASVTGSTVGVYAVDGMAGAGKTALAVHAAHELAPKFPDGQLFLRLYANTAGHTPVHPEDALGALLQVVGVDARDIPTGLDARTARWRSWLAGKKVLVLLDDAAGHEQVRPLLPGVAGCAVLITSRRRLAALEGAVPLPVGMLPMADAVRLFCRTSGRADLRSAEVAELVELVGALPLAIQLLAGKLAHRPVWTVHDLISQLSRAVDRTAAIGAENATVSAAFELSYTDLPERRQRLFRRLGLQPCVDVEARAVAALAGVDLGAATAGLEALYDARLIDEPSHGRYRFHDLIRDYARVLAGEDPVDENEAALNRLVDHYLRTATVADRLIREQAPDDDWPPTAEFGLSDRCQALAWVDTERFNLAAIITYAGERDDIRACRLAHAISNPLTVLGKWEQARALDQLALELARRLADLPAQTRALDDLGVVLTLTSDYEDAKTSFGEALDLHRELDDPRGQAEVRTDLGHAQYLSGELAAAEASQTRALRFYRDNGDPSGKILVLHRLGLIRRRKGDYEAACSALAEAMELSRDLRYRFGEARSLHLLGMVRRRMGDFDAARSCATEALELYRALGYKLGQADALLELGMVWQAAGSYQAAYLSLTEASRPYIDLGERLGQAEVLNTIADVMRSAKLVDAALRYNWEGFQLARGVASPLEQARALEGIGRSLLERGQRQQAESYVLQALEIYERLGVPEAERCGQLLATITGIDPDDRPDEPG